MNPTHPRPEWTHNRFDAARRLPPLLSGVRDPEGIRPPMAEMIRAGTPEQFFRAAFMRGARDALREAWRVACPVCRPRITALAWGYEGEAA
jgi:hypothetical protein